MSEQEPRELTPMQMFFGNDANVKDFRPLPQKVDPEEVRLAEEAMTPAPKDSPAQESAALPGSSDPLGQSASEIPVQALVPPIPVAVTQQSDAASESGKPSESNEDAPATPSPPMPSPAPSSPSSSSATSPGKPKQPAPVQPPTKG